MGAARKYCCLSLRGRHVRDTVYFAQVGAAAFYVPEGSPTPAARQLSRRQPEHIERDLILRFKFPGGGAGPTGM